MNKKNYFYFLWALSSIPTIIWIILMFVTGEYLDTTSPVELRDSTGIVFTIILGMLSIIFHGFILTMGLHFVQKIGARLLLWNGDYDFKKDIFKPAMIIGIIASCIICTINMFWPFEWFYSIEQLPVFMHKALAPLLHFITYDINLLLFWIAGLALLIKKITKSDAMNMIMYTSIVLVAFLGNMASPVAVGPMVRCGIDVVLGVLFWKKGFETAVLCHLIMILMFYVIAPFVMSVVAA